MWQPFVNLFKTMVNFANMLLKRLRLCYTWTLVWTWRKTPIAKLFLFFFFSLYLWVINNSLAQYIHLYCFTVTRIKDTSCMYYVTKTIFSCDLHDFQYPFVCLTYLLIISIMFHSATRCVSCKYIVRREDRSKNFWNIRVL